MERLGEPRLDEHAAGPLDLGEHHLSQAFAQRLQRGDAMLLGTCATLGFCGLSGWASLLGEHALAFRRT